MILDSLQKWNNNRPAISATSCAGESQIVANLSCAPEKRKKSLLSPATTPVCRRFHYLKNSRNVCSHGSLWFITSSSSFPLVWKIRTTFSSLSVSHSAAPPSLRFIFCVAGILQRWAHPSRKKKHLNGNPCLVYASSQHVCARASWAHQKFIFFHPDSPLTAPMSVCVFLRYS